MQNGIKLVLLPFDNRNDATELPEDVKSAIEIKFCSKIEEVLTEALEKDIDHEFIKNAFKPLFTSKM